MQNRADALAATEQQVTLCERLKLSNTIRAAQFRQL